MWNDTISFKNDFEIQKQKGSTCQPSSVCWKSSVKVLTGLVFGVTPPPPNSRRTLGCCVFMLFFLFFYDGLFVATTLSTLFWGKIKLLKRKKRVAILVCLNRSYSPANTLSTSLHTVATVWDRITQREKSEALASWSFGRDSEADDVSRDSGGWWRGPFWGWEGKAWGSQSSSSPEWQHTEGHTCTDTQPAASEGPFIPDANICHPAAKIATEK